MKKALAITLSVLLILSTIPMAFASSDYNRAKVASGDKTTIDNLSAEQIAGVILDWVDREIAAAAEDFSDFDEQLSLTGMTVPTNLDGIIGYKDYITLLGGDFANLDTSALTTRTAAGSDLQFIYNVISFVAANSDTFGKVFAWEEGQTFDFGAVGEYITNPDNNVDERIVDFYNNYLIGNDIQEKFVNEIAREMGYTIPEGETFDETIDNGIKTVVAEFLSEAGLISDELYEKIVAADDEDYDLKTTDVYTLVKTLFTDIQVDNWDKLTTNYRYLCDNLIRPVLKTAFGYTLTETTTAAPAAVLNEFKAAYDLDILAETAGTGDVLYRSNDGKYYSIKADASSGKEVTYGESFISLEPPTVEIGDKNTVIGTYTPTSVDTATYQPAVYTSQDYSQYIDEDMMAAAGEFGVTVTADALPEAITAIITEELNKTAMVDEFKMTVGSPVNQTIEITFEEIETAANEALAAQLPTIQAQVDSVVAAAVATANNMPFIGGSITGSVTINSVTVKLSYTGYSDEDTFVCQVTAVPTINATYNGNVWTYASMVGMTQDKIESDYIQPAVDNAITNPVATIVVDNLNGSVDGLDDLTALMNYVDTDFAVDTSILDFAENYDDYNGVIGQVNRLLCDVVEMVLSDEGYASLKLTEGGNENLTANMQKICTKTDSLLSAAKQFMDRNAFAEFAESINLSGAFASEHGFNAGMLYDLDFSDVENVYVCGLRMGCDLLVEDEEGTLYDIHLIIEDLKTLEQMAVGIFNYAMPDLIEKLNESIADTGIELSFTATTTPEEIVSDAAAKEYIMTKLVDLLYDAAVQAVPVFNGYVNDTIAEICGEAGVDEYPEVEFVLGVEKGETYEETLTALVNRFYELTEGIFRSGVLADDDADVYEKISALANNFLPLASMLSNAGKNGANGSIDVSYILSVLFDECLDGNFDNFLRMFEVKEDELAGEDPVTYVLIKTSQHMTDAVFPGTVVASDYTASDTVQQEFTSSENDVVIASDCMQSLDTYKEEVVPAALNLVREAGVLPFFARCSNHVYGDAVTTAATCTEEGAIIKTCTVCGYEDVTTIPIDANNHASVKNVAAVEATCTKEGSKAGTKCTACGKVISGCEAVAAKGHTAVTIPAVAATCTKAGSTEGTKCSVCGTVISKSATVAAKGHSYSAWATATEPTCTEAGVQTRSCPVCGDTQTQTIAATGNHNDADGDGSCDTCGKQMNEEDNSFIGKIKSFFRKIISFFQNLFKR